MTRLGDVCAIRYGKDHKKLSDGSIPTYGSGGIMRYVDTAICEQPSVLIPRKGTLGNLFYTDEPFWTVDTLFWTDIDQTKIVPKYLYYQLKQKDLASYNVGTAVPSLTVEVLNEIDLDVPSIDKQRRIVEVLNSFDSKIALNNQLNDYLLELISSVFAHRFSSNVNTTDLKNVLSISTKALKPQEHASEIWEHYSIPAFDEKHRPIFEPASEIKSNKYQIDNECILISKLNPSTKRIWMPYCSSNNAVCSTEFIVYRPYLKEYKSFYYAAIDSPGFTDYLLEHVSGSTGSRQRAQPKDTLHYLMPNPSNEEIKNFCTFADPIYRHVQINEQQTAKLELLRDTLLPKLMSGEIDVSKIDLTQLTNNHLVDC